MKDRILHFLATPFRHPKILPRVVGILLRIEHARTNCGTLWNWFVLRRFGLGVFHMDKSGKAYIRHRNGQITSVVKKDKK